MKSNQFRDLEPKSRKIANESVNSLITISMPFTFVFQITWQRVIFVHEDGIKKI